MSISSLRDELQGALANFLWNEWGLMGVAMVADRHEPRAVDPEALLLLTFEVGRSEPRLFEEVLDWMLVNERLVSVQRLRNLATDDADKALVEAVIGWLGQGRTRQRLKARSRPAVKPQALFRGSRLETVDPDSAFEAQGFLTPRIEPSRLSQEPDVTRPINLAFKLRQLLGMSVRAEVVRVLLTTDSPWMNGQALAETTAYSKRNVQEALASLTVDDFVDQPVTVHNENRYTIPRDRWAMFLNANPLPGSIDWPQASRLFRRILRWLIDSADRDLSDYMLMSNARTLVETIEPDLRFAGFSPLRPADWTRDLASFEGFVRELVRNVLSVDM